MPSKRGVWTLNNTYYRNTKNQWNKENYATIPSPDPISGNVADYIYTFFSGRNYEKFDMSNDVAQADIKSLGSGIRSHKDYIVATSNQNAAFYTGLAVGVPSLSTKISDIIYKLDYSNDTSSNFGTAINFNRVDGFGVGNQNYGWFYGGRMQFNGLDYGESGPIYWYDDDYLDLIGPNFSDTDVTYHQQADRLDYSSGTVSRSNVNIPDGITGYKDKKYFSSACNNDYAWTVYSYFFDELVKTDLSNETSSTSPITKSTEFSSSSWRKEYASAGGNANYMWVTGGYHSIYNPSTYYSPDRSIFRLDYSNDTMSSTSRNLLPLRQAKHGQSGNQSYGYLNHGIQNIRQKIDYANDTADYDYTTAISTDLDNRIQSLFSSDNPNVDPIAVPWQGDVESYYRSNVKCTSVSATQWNLPTSLSPVSYSPIPGPGPSPGSPSAYFYYAGGSKQEDRTSSLGPVNYYERSSMNPLNWSGAILRWSYSNDSTIPTFRGYTNTSGFDNKNIWNSSTNNANYAWLNRGGGDPIQRLDFSNDSGTSTRNSNWEGHDHAASGNANYGYWFGGRGQTSYTRWGSSTGPGINIDGLRRYPTSNVWRTDYSNDTANPIQRAGIFRLGSGPTYSGLSRSGATTNGSYVWLYSGFDTGSTSHPAYDHGYPEYPYDDGPSSWPRAIWKYDLSNDTSLLTKTRTFASQYAFGWYPVSLYATYSGISWKYGSTANPGVKAVGNQNYGYVRQWEGTPRDLSWNLTYDFGNTIHGYRDNGIKLNYSNDVDASWGYVNDGAGINVGTDATGNNDYGYFGRSTSHHKVDYSNDTFSNISVGYFGAHGMIPNIADAFPGSNTGNPNDFGTADGSYIGYTAFSGARNQ